MEDLEKIILAEGFDVTSRNDCRSRLIHVIARVKRAKPVSPEGQTLAFEIVLAAEARLTDMNQTVAALVAAHRRNSLASSFTNSPLAEAIESIQSTRNNNSPVVNSQNQVATDKHGLRGARRSLLNPAVESFVPSEGVASGGSGQVPVPVEQPQLMSRPPINEMQQVHISESDRSQFTGARPAIGGAAFFDNFRRIERNRLEPSEGRLDRGFLSGAVPVIDVVLLDNFRNHNGRQERDGLPRAEQFGNVAVMNNFRYYNEPHCHEVNIGQPMHRQKFRERDFDNGEDRLYQRDFGRQRRKTVPVHQWKLSYSGDGQGLHLYDFLSEIRMFQRSEGVTEAELLSSVVHLLSGRARMWYRSWFDTFKFWDDLVAGINKEFLPPKYVYKLLNNISNRRQKPTENFAEYLNLILTMFKHLTIPIVDQHTLCIIEDNMLPKYAIATSVIEINSLEQLSNVCRRVDFAYVCSARKIT